MRDFRNFIFTSSGFGVKRVSRDAIKKNLKTLLHIAKQAKFYKDRLALFIEKTQFKKRDCVCSEINSKHCPVHGVDKKDSE